MNILLKNIINQLELNISKQIEQTVNCKEFFNLPIENILNIVEKVDLTDIDDSIEFLKTFITKTVEKHSNERETLSLLFSLKTQSLNLSFEEIIEIIQLFKNSSLCRQLGNAYTYNSQLPTVDFDFLLEEKDEKIQNLQKQINDIKIAEKPSDYEPKILKAISEGKLSSVQYYFYEKRKL